MRIALLVLIAMTLSGCSRNGLGFVYCHTGPDLHELGLVERDGRIWTVDENSKRLGELAYRAARCETTRRTSVAFISSGTSRFIGAVRYTGSRIRPWGESTRFLDDFSGNRDRRRAARGCSPVDLIAMKKSHEIVEIRDRLVVTRSDSLSTVDMGVASEWLMRCLPAVDAIGWVTTDGKVLGSYHDRLLDRFE